MTLLAIVLAIVPLVLAAWVLVCLLREYGVHPFREAVKFLPRGVLGVENGKWKVENGGVVAAGDSTTLRSTLYTLHSISTNDTYSFSMPSNGVCHSRWRRRGAADDWFPLSPAGWSFALGDTSVTNLRVFSRGKSRLPDGTEISPLPATLGIVPEANWQLLGSNSPSLFWHSLSSDGSLLLTWQHSFC